MKVFGETDVGCVRQSNQDTFKYFLQDESSGFIFVCDGMGGPGGGEIASNYVADKLYNELSKKFEKMDMNKIVDEVDVLLNEANGELIELSHNEGQYEGMGTTVVMAFVKGGKCLVVNLGDSRAYHIHDDNVYQISRDHSVVQQMIDDGKITADEGRHHPQKNIITRAVGAYDFAQADFFEFDIYDDSILLLCSDGLSNYVDENEMLFEVTMADSLESACSSLVEIAKERGGNDNITVVLLKVNG